MVSLLPIGKAEDVKEQNQVSGSKGEANFVWRCKSCKVNNHLNQVDLPLLTRVQREATATIKHPPQAYTHASPPKKQNIVEFDCRGLEFTEFKSDACLDAPIACATLLTPW